MQIDNKEIIERVLGHNNYEMWQKCELLKKVINANIEVKEGRGKNVRIINKYKHNVPTEVRKKIVDSCEYYKQLMETDKEQIDAVIDIVNAVPEVFVSNTIQFRDYQTKIIYEGAKIIKEHGFLYLAMEVRTGKTLTSLGIAGILNVYNVLFLTKKKAISSIENDYKALAPFYDLFVINYESIHTIPDTKWDLIITDESHSCFLEDTLIDGVKIKDIELGSFQKSFNFAKGIYEYKKVLNVFKNPLTENLIKIKCNGKKIVCTESHKIFTKRGWVKAGELLSTDELQIL
jgi:hypothetical protein